MSKEEQTVTDSNRAVADALSRQMENVRIARENGAKARRGRRLIVPYRDTIPQKKVER